MTWPPPFQPPMQATYELEQQQLQQQHHQQQQQIQAAEISAENGNFLLQFLKSGCGSSEQLAAQQQQAEAGGGYWQILDPAVAALGPSHSFQMVPPPPPAEHNQQQQLSAGPMFMPQHVRFGWSPPPMQPDRVFPAPNDNPFLTPTDHGFLHPFALQVERPFHPSAPAPYPFANPPSFPTEPTRVDGAFHQIPQHQPPGPGPVQRFGNLEVTDISRLPTDITWPELAQAPRGPGIDEVQLLEHHPAQHFYGNGAELLQLLQGGPGRAKGTDSTDSKADPQLVTLENGDLVGDAKVPQRGSPSTVHGPIGPPKRQFASPPQSPNDILGRFWAALPPSGQHPLFGPDQNHMSQPAQLSSEAEDPKLGDENGAGAFLLLKRGTSKLPLDGFEHRDANDCSPDKSYQQSNTSAQDGFSRGRFLANGADADTVLDDFPGANGRRKSGGRPEAKRMAKGQWVAVNESKQSDNQRDTQNETQKTAASTANGFHSKMRDELKRRRKLQQEWRVKSPQSVGSSADSRMEAKLCRGPSLASQLEHPGLPCGSTQDSAVGSALDESKQRLHSSDANAEEEAIADHLADLELDEAMHEPKNNFFQKPRQQRFRESRRCIPMHRKEAWFRPDLQKFTSQLITIYKELIPTEDAKSRRKDFLSRLDSLVEKEWPGARLFLFGSCANAFGVCNSDIDVCLTVDDEEPNKAELVVKMAAILESDEMLNVQALTHARVPIVKFTDPVTSISCDICVNNMLAVVNSKLLHDYAQIDIRLRQLAFMVKHWAKRRQVNETYRGTLSSYAYVLMCIHFLQQRRPPILPCLQEMPATYEVKVGDTRCSYYDKVENLKDFGARNKETLGELLTAFFEYWAHEHEYNNSVVSVRTGGYLSKEEKNWTRRIGNERHLICIEDPFEVQHDLGRVVDKHSIKALRGEFYRAASVMKSDPNPCVRLFEPYIREYNDQE